MQMEKVCPTCGAKNNPSALLCQRCSGGLGDVLPQPVNVPSPPSRPRQGTPSHQPSSRHSPPSRKTGKRSRFVVPLLALCIVLLLIFLIPGVIKGIMVAISKTSTPPYTHMTPTVNPSIDLSLPPKIGEVKAPTGENVGVNDGSYSPFNTWYGTQELGLKQQAAQALHSGNGAAAVSLWKSALKINSSDAEALIYIENQSVLESAKPYLTLVVGVAFVNSDDSSPVTQLQGVYVAQHEYNSSSSPFKLRILIANSGQEVSYALPIARQIAQIASQDKTVVGVVGWLTSSRSHETLPVLSAAKLPQISPQASDDGLSGISTYFFRVAPANRVEAPAAAKFAEQALHVKNPVVFLDPGDNYSQNLANDFENQFVKDGYPRPHEETFTTDKTKSFASLIQDALNRYHPDAFYFTSPSVGDTGLFQDALPTNGPFATLPVISGDAGYVVHPKSYNRWFFTSFAFADAWNLIEGKDNNTPFFQDYSSDFNPDGLKPGGYYGFTRPDDTAILSYDATQVLLKGIQLAQSGGKTTLTSQDVAAALPKITGAQAYQGVSGQIAFDANHDPINKAVVFLYTSADGHLQMKSYQGCFIKGCP